jgi:hypothetical protein
MLVANGGRITVPLFVRRHQRAILDHIIASPLVRGACKLMEQRRHNPRGSDASGRDNGNGSRYQSSIRIMISYYARGEGGEAGAV